MAFDRKHSLYAVRLGVTALPVVLGGIESQDIRTGTTVNRESKSGELYARWASITAQKPGANFTTLALKTALDEISVLGLDIATLTNAAAGLDLFAYKHLKGGTRAGTLAHRQYNIKQGMLVPRRLTANHQDDASLRCEAIAQWDGSNDPVAVTDGVTLPTGVTDAERFALGKCTIESLAIPEVKSFDLDFGLKVVGEGEESDLWDTYVSIVEVMPTITLRGIDIEWFKSTVIPLLGKGATHANTTIYLRKRKEPGDFEANNVAVHIKITADGLVHVDDAFDGSGTDGAECSLTFLLTFDNTNTPVVINTASAIT